MSKNLKMFVSMGLMIALNILLSRYLVIYLTDDIRISLGTLPILLSGILFGPVAGMITGGVADILGSMLSGRGWYPLLTISPIFVGLISGIVFRVFRNRKDDNTKYLNVILTVFSAHIPTSMLWSTYCLTKLYESTFEALVIIRVPLYIVTGIVEIILLYNILKIPFLKQMAYGKPGAKLKGKQGNEL